MTLNGQSVSRETQERLEHFVELFKKWNATTNLVAPSTLKDLWSRHVADSAQIFQLAPKPQTWVDLGSGGGFPGVITAIFLAEHQDGWVHLVESNHKKAAFLRVALSETGLAGQFTPFGLNQHRTLLVHVMPYRHALWQTWTFSFPISILGLRKTIFSKPISIKAGIMRRR